MSSPFPSSSSASSPPSYLMPRPPPPLMLPMQYATNGVGVPNGAGATVASVPSLGRRQHPSLPRPPPRQCPRCRSANTKFCYYNNYSRTQPRYLCKACRRHWTDGGTLRDVPVGGGRKNKRHTKSGATPKSSTATATSAMATSNSDAFPEILRQVLLQPGASVCGSVYGIDLSSWQQMGTTMPRGGYVGAAGGTALEVVNCGGLQYWSEWQDDVPGLDGTC